MKTTSALYYLADKLTRAQAILAATVAYVGELAEIAEAAERGQHYRRPVDPQVEAELARMRAQIDQTATAEAIIARVAGDDRPYAGVPAPRRAHLSLVPDTTPTGGAA